MISFLSNKQRIRDAMRTGGDLRPARRTLGARAPVRVKARLVMYGSGLRTVAFVAVWAAAAALVSSVASAHEIGISRGDYSIDGATVTAELALARADLVDVVPGADSDGDGVVSAAELAAASGAIDHDVVRAIHVRGDTMPCAPSFVGAELVEKDGVVVRAKYACDGAPRLVTIDVDVIAAMRRGHRHIARARVQVRPHGEASVIDAVLDRDDARLALQIPASDAEVARADSHARRIGAFVALGMLHVFTGFDHMLFVFALVLVGGRARSLAGVVTAFTVAHSITLALATLGVWTPSSRIVEPAIALSIAYVGVENFFVKSAEERWRITFPFGLVHGFGFASALGGAGIARADAGRALFGFNVGVELAQLALLAVVLPALAVLRKRGWLGEPVVRITSAVVVAIGVLWFVMRVARPT